jgi:hypothetical protein
MTLSPVSISFDDNTINTFIKSVQIYNSWLVHIYQFILRDSLSATENTDDNLIELSPLAITKRIICLSH